MSGTALGAVKWTVFDQYNDPHEEYFDVYPSHTTFFATPPATEWPVAYRFSADFEFDGSNYLNCRRSTSSVDGFMSAADKSKLDAYPAYSSINSAMAGKMNNPAGTSAQYIRGDGSMVTFPTNLSSFTNGPGFITGITSSDVTTALGFTPYNSSNPSAYVNQAGARSAISITTTGSGAASYSSSTGVINIPTPATAGFTINDNVSRSLNSNYSITNNTKGALCSYSINVSWSVAALLSGNGSAFLEYSLNGGTNWTTVNQVSKNIGLLTFAGADDLNLVGFVPASALIRIRTSASNMTVAYTRGQEDLFT